MIFFNLKSTEMKKIFFAAFVLTLVSCDQKEWSKGYISKKCKEGMKGNEASKVMTDEQMNKICDCPADKMMVKYKAEADIDTLGMQDIPLACAIEIMAGDTK
jgi:hypothetical protein